MGDPKKSRKQYDSPRRPWDKGMLERERKILSLYGLKNKREIRMLERILRDKRKNARALLGMPLETRAVREKELLASIARMGLLKSEGTVDDILGLSLEEILERRLQSMVWRKNLAKTINQARQFIVHGHIAVKGKRVNIPGYLVSRDEEAHLGYYGEPPELEPPKPEKKGSLKAEFEAAAGLGGGEAVAAGESGAGFLKAREARVKEQLAEADAGKAQEKAEGEQ